MNKEAIIIRKLILNAAHAAGGAHIPSSFSLVEILLALYTRILNKNDFFILSKGHGCLALYAALCHLGIISIETLNSFTKNTSILGGHPDRNKIPEVHVSSGSLGHGLPIAVGIALGVKIEKKQEKIYCVIGDGECNEGSIWEALLLANRLELNNLICIVDNNNSQIRSVPLVNLKEKFQSFGFTTVEVDGHNLNDLEDALLTNQIIIANTVKGKGIERMENNMFEWHHRGINLSELYEMELELDEKTIC